MAAFVIIVGAIGIAIGLFAPGQPRVLRIVFCTLGTAIITREAVALLV